MSFLEEQYLRRLSYKLRNYKEKGGHVYNFSCPVCGDSAKKKNKARGYAFDKSGSLLVKCWNCGYSSSFPKFLESQDALLHQEFVMERFKERGIKQSSEIAFIEEMANTLPVETKHYVPNIFDGLPAVKDLPSSNEARAYADKRMLPMDKFDMFYAQKFVEWTQGHSEKFRSWRDSDHSRIVFPFYARDGHVMGYAARALNGEEPKYYRIFVGDNEKERFFGMDKLDETKQVYVLEGEIDSMFIPNALAMSNGKLDVYYNPDAIYIPDCDVRNIHIMKGVEKLIDRNLNVCMLPPDDAKDINELVMNGYSEQQLVDLIHKHTYRGLTAKLHFHKWKKCL